MRFFIPVIFFLILPGALLAEGVSPKAKEVTELFGFLPVTNSMLTSWIISAFLILLFRWWVGKPSLIPSKGQMVVETVVQGVKDLIAPVVGRRLVSVTFPLLAALFCFILIHNWSGMLPGVGTLYYGEKYIIRPANADLNMTLALALIHFVAWIYIVMKYAGPKVLAYDLFGNKADKSEVPGPIYLFLFLIFFAVGLIEIISIIFRPVSLSFRLFGNVFGGENLLHNMTGLISWIVPVPFYFLEILIGFVQALVFTLLVAVYIGLICNHGDEEHAH